LLPVITTAWPHRGNAWSIAIVGRFTLTAVGPGSDPTPANNVTTVGLDVADDNDR
jgi:hypothetical protein